MENSKNDTKEYSLLLVWQKRNSRRTEALYGYLVDFAGERGWTLQRWDETNCDLEANEFVREGVRQKRWAFVSDYFRMKALYEHGGLYLDIDTEMRRDPSRLFENARFVCGYIVDCCVHTHVLASAPGCEIPYKMLGMYEHTKFVDTPLAHELEFGNSGEVYSNGLTTNNYYLTRLLLDNYPNFKLDGETAEFAPGYFIYDKSLFTTGSLLNREYFFDLSYGSWRGEKGKDSWIKRAAAHTPFFAYLQKLARIKRSQDITGHVFYQDWLDKRKSMDLAGRG